MDDGAMDVGETVIPTGVPVSEPLVIKTHQVEDRSVEVVGVDRLYDRSQPVFVSRAVDDPPPWRRRRPATT